MTGKISSDIFTPKLVYVLLLCAVFAHDIAYHMISPILPNIGATSGLGHACASCGVPCEPSGRIAGIDLACFIFGL